MSCLDGPIGRGKVIAALAFWATCSVLILRTLILSPPEDPGDTLLAKLKCRRPIVPVHNLTQTAHQKTYEYEEFLSGPGLKTANMSTATCRLPDDGRSGHLPHAMQNLYPCYSFWRAHPHLPPVLVYGSRSMPLPKGPFLPSLLQVLESTLNLTIVHETDAPIVTARCRHWCMHDPTDARTLRRMVLEYFHIIDSSSSNSAVPRIGILNRRATRSLLNSDQIRQSLQDKFNTTNTTDNTVVDVGFFEDASFREQIEWFAKHDLVVSPHGAQLTGLPFMPECGGVLELMPSGFDFSEYFGSLSAVAGILHYHLYLGTGPNKTAEVAVGSRNSNSRKRRRRPNWCVDAPSIVKAVQTMVTNWRRCQLA